MGMISRDARRVTLLFVLMVCALVAVSAYQFSRSNKVLRRRGSKYKELYHHQ
jgi:hypothetical protein